MYLFGYGFWCVDDVVWLFVYGDGLVVFGVDVCFVLFDGGDWVIYVKCYLYVV